MQTDSRNPFAAEPGVPLSLLASDVLARPMWSIEDVAVLMNLPASTVRALVKEHPIEGAFMVGRQVRFMRDSVESWFEALQKARPYVPRKNNTRRAA